MSASFRFTSKAVSDLAAIWNFIAEHNRPAADRVEQSVISSCHLLGKFPLIGRERPDITLRPLRFWILPKFRNYVIVYRHSRKPIEIIGILHGKRDLSAILAARE